MTVPLTDTSRILQNNKAMNYQKELEKIITELPQGQALLLHSCCAPCSSYVLEYLSSYFKITVFYYNPNITDTQEYTHRVAEQKRLIAEMPTKYPVDFIEGEYQPDLFWQIAKGMEDCLEGGERCKKCYELRLRKSAELAKEKGFDFFTTTLTISPLKPADALNEIGNRLAEEYGVPWLPSDFKKKNGFKRSTELSEIYGLYRQNYCGCEISRLAAKKRLKKSEE